jgi:lipopolysaccharide/colanic/teichoic acid biosynthesis glycosyltransferase
MVWVGGDMVDENSPMDRRAAIAIVERAIEDATAAGALLRLQDPELEHQVLAALRVKRRTRLTKRALDLLVASLGLVAVAPLLLVIALAIKLDSRGPITLPQKRLGRGR